MFSMPRVNKILANNNYQGYMQKIKEMESQRKFCKHTLEHSLAVARIAYIYLLEQEGEEIDKEADKEVIYAAALLHDIGRWVEYQTGEDHAQASTRLARPLLEELGFLPAERERILQAILEHRRHHDDHLTMLGRALALADDWSRECVSCKAKDECHKFNDTMLQIFY